MYYDGNAVVYCERAFTNTYGKTAHGLIRFTERYNVIAVIDSEAAPGDAGAMLDGKDNGITLVKNLAESIDNASSKGVKLTHFVIGVATDGGYLTEEIRNSVLEALNHGLHVDSGLHDYLSADKEISLTASLNKVRVRDIRKPHLHSNHLFSGKIKEVGSLKIAVLGTDSALGKRTTSWLLVQGLRNRGLKAEMIGTGQTAWLQGARYSMVLDSLVNDYVSGELEHTLWTAWKEQQMDVAVIEGQGSLMNPAYPGGFEILAACRPDGVVLQHAPTRKDYDGFPGYPLDPLKDQIFLIEFLSKKKVIAISVNHEGIPLDGLDRVCNELEEETGLPVVDPLVHGVDRILDLLEELCRENKAS